MLSEREEERGDLYRGSGGDLAATRLTRQEQLDLNYMLAAHDADEQ